MSVGIEFQTLEGQPAYLCGNCHKTVRPLANPMIPLRSVEKIEVPKGSQCSNCTKALA